MGTRFTADTTSDQKRLARGEQLLLARSYLRARDCAHHKAWRVLMLCGYTPSGEIGALRELMPRCYIVGVDKEDAAVCAAAPLLDESICCDLNDFVVRNPRAPSQKFPAVSLADQPKFDLIDMDLCQGPGMTSRQIATTYYGHSLRAGGVFILTCSYGRDVVEHAREALFRLLTKMERDQGHNVLSVIDRLRTGGADDSVLGRLAVVLSPTLFASIASVVLYRGAEMPMMSVLIVKGRIAREVSFIRLADGDFELAVCYPDPSKMYDCPQDRILSLRRRFAAMKAVCTRELAVKVAAKT